jgi:hypothetical protein
MGREKSRGKVKIFDAVKGSRRSGASERSERGGANAETLRRTGTVRRRTERERYTVPKSPTETPSNEPKLSDDERKVALGKVKYVVSKNKATKDFSVYESNVE